MCSLHTIPHMEKAWGHDKAEGDKENCGHGDSCCFPKPSRFVKYFIFHRFAHVHYLLESAN